MLRLIERRKHQRNGLLGNVEGHGRRQGAEPDEVHWHLQLQSDADAETMGQFED